MITYTALFKLGRTLATPAAQDELSELNYSPLDLLRKHMSGDWSEMALEDEQSNQESIRKGSRIFSAYYRKLLKSGIIK